MRVAVDDLPLILVWREGELRPATGFVDEPLLATDSWLVDEGRVRGYDRHWSRFGAACEELRIAAAEVAGFRDAVTAALPRTGRWFPRIDLVGSAAGRAAVLALRLRPAQPRVCGARVLVAAPGDLRGHPRRKGPDLPLLLRLREEAVAAGADELAVCDARGRLLEGALNSLMWWEGDALCATPCERTLPSVTRGLLLDIASARGVPVRRRAPLPAELAGREAWLVNAANGICVVTAWLPGAIAAGAPEQASTWQAALEATARPLDGAVRSLAPGV
jgi:branched-subunit amino acid aminotransferase/4-amino-4-deoxychorismate lyase